MIILWACKEAWILSCLQSLLLSRDGLWCNIDLSLLSWQWKQQSGAGAKLVGEPVRNVIVIVQLRDDAALLACEEIEDYSIEDTKLALVTCGVLLGSEVVHCPLSSCISWCGISKLHPQTDKVTARDMGNGGSWWICCVLLVAIEKISQLKWW